MFRGEREDTLLTRNTYARRIAKSQGNNTMNTDDLNFAYKVRHALNEHLDDLPASTTDRLAQARQQALARKKAHVEAPLRVRVSKNALAGAGTGFFSFTWMTRMSVALPLLVLVGGLVGIYQYEQEQRGRPGRARRR